MRRPTHYSTGRCTILPRTIGNKNNRGQTTVYFTAKSEWVRDMNAWLAEYRRPWKLATLAAGIGLLILGSFRYQAPD